MDARVNSTVFLIDPTPYRVLRVSPHTSSLRVCPSFGSGQASFFVPFSSVWSPPKPVTSLAVNTDFEDVEMPLMSPSPVPPRVILSDVDQATLTSPLLTHNVATFTDSAADMEFAALLKDTDDLDVLNQELQVERGRLARLEAQFQTHRHTMEQTQMKLATKTKENAILDRNVKDLKATLADLKNDIESLQADRGALPMLHEILYSMCAPADVYIDKVTSQSYFYKILGCNLHSSAGDIKKHYHRLMRLSHPDKHPHLSRHISQRLNEIYAVLSDERSRRIYDCCGIDAVQHRDSSHFCRLCNPAPTMSPSMISGRKQCEDAFRLEGGCITDIFILNLVLIYPFLLEVIIFPGITRFLFRIHCQPISINHIFSSLIINLNAA